MSKIKDTIGEGFKEPIREYSFDAEKHIHSLTGRPLMGTSTVVGVLAKPLTWWASGLAVALLGWINKGNAKKGWVNKATRLVSAGAMLAKVKLMTDEQYLSLLDDAYKAHSVKLDSSATAGTDMHAELEQYVNRHMLGGDIASLLTNDRMLQFHNWVTENVDIFLWSEIYCYDEDLWVGGISDVGVKLKNGQVGVLDFKSSKDSYESQFIQCAGYDIQITKNGGFTKDGYKVFTLKEKIEFYAIIPFGAEEFKVDYRYNVAEMRDGFKSCCTLYKLTNK